MILRKTELYNILFQAVREAGWSVLYRSSPDAHPMRCTVYHDDESYRLCIYIWNITHGGGKARPQHEYRIQVTPTTRFVVSPDEKTLILGWDASLRVLAAFDVRKRPENPKFSPSLQIRSECLQQASIQGFAPCAKGNQEIAVAFRSDFLVEYIRHLEALHDFGKSDADVALLERVSEYPQINTEDILVLDQQRKTIVQTLTRKLRDARFRSRILVAYRSQCAMCGIQLELVDAAHIVPVFHERSSDETHNGMALCALHHRAYDNSLVTVLEDYSIKQNVDLIMDLQNRGLGDGSEMFSKGLLPRINVPPAVNDRPHKELIRLANEIRGWKLS